MPTGYTEGIASGQITSFEEYALLCARNFGACIMLRDEPLTPDIPEFQPSDYHVTALLEARTKLHSFINMSEEERLKLYREERSKETERAIEKLAEIDEQKSRYEAMLEKAKQFKPPTPEHQEYARFLISQLIESIKWDCDTDYYDKILAKQITFEAWEAEKLNELESNLQYHIKEQREEVERTNSRNKWIKQLRAAILEI